MQSLLCHAKSAAYIISIIMDAPCTPKQIDLTSVLLLQLPLLLLTCCAIPYSGNLLREKIFANLAILLSEEIFAIFKFNY